VDGQQRNETDDDQALRAPWGACYLAQTTSKNLLNFDNTLVTLTMTGAQLHVSNRYGGVVCNWHKIR